MARKFSLKDNPIFQRLEIPHPSTPKTTAGQQLSVPISDISEETVDPQKQTLKNRPSNFDRLNSQDGSQQEIEQVLSSNLSNNDEEQVEDRTSTMESRPTEVGKEVQQRVEILEGQLLTLKNKPSKSPSYLARQEQEGTDEENVSLLSEPQLPYSVQEVEGGAIRSTNFSENQQGEETAEAEGTQVGSVQERSALGLKDHLEKSLFFGFYNEVSDSLLPTLETAEQVLYARLFRLSYGFNRNYCTVSQPLLQERTGLSRNTVRTSLQSLLKRGLLAVVDAGNHISTTYRVYLPREQQREAIFDPQKQTLKNRPSKTEGQNQRVKARGAKNDIQEGQFLEGQILTLEKEKQKKESKDEDLGLGGAIFEGQKLPPLLITNNSLTLSQREKKIPTNQNKEEDNENNATAALLVEFFYSQFVQTPTAEKRERGVKDCLSLLNQGFSEQQIRSAIEWIRIRYPETGSFSRVVHLIDQALKAKEQDGQRARKEQEKKREEEQKTNEEQRAKEEGRRIEEIKTSLPQPELDSLIREARQLVENEQGQVRFGKETLVQLKIRQLIRERFL